MVRKQSHGKPCPYCQRKMERHHPKLEPTREHSLPRSKGGTAAHVIIVCIQCNTIKADMMPDQWAAFMERVPGWWKLTKSELRAARGRAGMLFVTPGQQARNYDKRNNQALGLTQRGNPKKAVVVPPGLIWRRDDLIQRTIEQDAQLRALGPQDRRLEGEGPTPAIGEPEAPMAGTAEIDIS